MSEPHLLIVAPRRRGRPRLSPSAPSTNVSVKMPEDLFDRACALAHQQRLTLPEVIRQAVERALAQPSE